MQQIYLHSNFKLKGLKSLKSLNEVINHPDYNYPRHPQSNGHIERCNRTIEEQYLGWVDEGDIERINEGLMDYLL